MPSPDGGFVAGCLVPKDLATMVLLPGERLLNDEQRRQLYDRHDAAGEDGDE